ncbi:MAG: hypothetical protein FJ038_13425 [Chloroflexi bacterium]|nr:hypothetical protein [Chloroflexota bacterium]
MERAVAVGQSIGVALMGSMSFTVEIDRPADEVWTYLVDPDHEPEWQQGVHSSAHTPAGPIRAGTRKVKVRSTPFGKQRFTVEYTRVDHSAREWDDVVVDGMVRGSTGHYRVTSTGPGSRVDLDVVMRGVGFMKVLMPVIDRSSRVDLAGGLQRLKVMLEGSSR